MKKALQAFLQKVLGFENYLFLFAWLKIRMIKRDAKEGDFRYFLDFIKPDSNVLDIGANIGIMTVHIAQKASRGKVLAFEPVPQNFKALQRILRSHNCKNVRLFDIALGNENKEIEMVLPLVEHVKMQGLSHVVDDSIPDFNEGEKFRVKAMRLDDMPEVKSMHIDAIKIDVENFEFAVFTGGASLIERMRPIIYCELWDNENRYKCFGFFREKNYSIRFIENGKLKDFDPAVHKGKDFFFIPR